MSDARDKSIVSLRTPKPKTPKRRARLCLKSAVRYANKTYHTFDALKGLRDSREAKSAFRLEDIASSAFMMMLMGFPGMNAFYNASQSMPKRVLRGCFLSSGCRVPSRVQAERILATVDAQQIRDMLWDMAKTADRNRVFEENKVDDLTLCILDGITIMTTAKKGKGPSFEKDGKDICPFCQEAHHKDGRCTSSHRVVAAGVPHIGGTGFFVLNAVLLKGADGVKKSEGELTGAKQLLKELNENMPGGADVFAGDALYANAELLKAVEAVGGQSVVLIKGEHRKAIQEAERMFSHGRGESTSFVAENRSGEKVAVTAWYLDNVEMTGWHKPIRLIRFTEVPMTEGELDTRIGSDGKLQRQESEYYVVCACPDIPIPTVWKIKHLRWDIEDSCFHVLSERSHVRHMYSHKACEQMLMLMLLAFNVRTMFLFRFRARDFVGRNITQADVMQGFKIQIHMESL